MVVSERSTITFIVFSWWNQNRVQNDFTTFAFRNIAYIHGSYLLVCIIIYHDLHKSRSHMGLLFNPHYIVS